MSLSAGNRVQTLKKEEVAELSRIELLFSDGAVMIHPEKALFPSRFLYFAEDYYSFKGRPTDVLIVGYPRTGTTWLQELIWNMTNDPNLDKESSDEIYFKSHFLDIDTHVEASALCEEPSLKEILRSSFPSQPIGQDNFKMLDLFEHIPDRRVLKTHLMPSLLNPQMLKVPKIIYMIRDPKDVLVSNYHIHRMWKIYSFKGDMEEFVEAFIAGKVVMGEYPNSIRQWWPYRNEENVHFVYYEDLNRNTMEELKKINSFLGTNLSEAQLERIMHASSIGEVKKQNSVLNFDGEKESQFFNKDYFKESGSFYRKGVVGSWKEDLSSELDQNFEAYLKDALQGIPLPYDYLRKSV